MSIRPMLFIGCGGSGGATLQYLMDDLKAELRRAAEAKAANEGVDVPLPPRVLPSAWQFVHADVPDRPDQGGKAKEVRPPDVPTQGGTYIGLAPEGISWRQVAQRVWTRGQATRPDLVAGWLRRPGDDPPLSQGAGQERAVGRGVTLDSLTKLASQLDQALGRMTSAQATAELRSLAAVLDTDTSPSPAVFIISSMAGGSGASMVLDVAQVLSRVRPNLDLGASTALFLYTSEVFAALDDSKRRGVEANGLAALGELLATSLGANLTEGELLNQLGVPGPVTYQPFKRVFPIGNKHGTMGATFGDGTPESIFRAMGRGFAGLVASPMALEEFLKYDMTNSLPQPTDLRWLGEGSATNDPVLWGTLGFARLSLGRERYGEYSAQRLARLAVDRLAEGHRRQESRSGEADLEAAAHDAHRRVLHRMGLAGDSVTVLSLLSRGSDLAMVREGIRGNMRDALGRLVFADGQLARPLPGARFLDTVLGLVRSRQGEVAMAGQAQAYALVHNWQAQFVVDLLAELDAVIARHGLPVARQVVIRLKDDAASWAHQLRAEAGRLAPGGSSALGPPADNLTASIRGQISVSPDHQLRQDLEAYYSERSARNAAAASAVLLAEVLADFDAGFAAPLANALADAYGRVLGDRGRSAPQAAVADLRTDIYAEWPAPGGLVPSRFDGAHNEIVLMHPEQYPAQFEAHLQAVARTRTGSTLTEATLESVLQEIITDRWRSHNDESARSVITTLRSNWVPEQLTVDPRDRTAVTSRSVAAFSFRLSAAEVLQRSRDWVWRRDGEFGPFLTEGLRQYMNPIHAQFEARMVELTASFEATLSSALPLVAVDPGAFASAHPNARLAEEFKFSAIPFQDLGGVDERLGRVIDQRTTAAQAAREVFEAALSQGNATTHIDVFATYAPMSPLAFSSLLQPLITSWRQSIARRDTEFFWRNRRARPLPGCLPMSDAERRAMIAGYVVGKLTGRLRGSYRTQPHQMASPIEVYSAVEQRWLAFPSPLLTPYAEPWDTDEVAALLESELLAIAECGFQSTLDPLRPYGEMRHLFGRVVQAQARDQMVDDQHHGYDTRSGSAHLLQWIVQGVRPPGADPLAVPAAETPIGRRDAALTHLRTLQREYSDHFRTGDPTSPTPTANPTLDPFDRRPLVGALAGDLVWAFAAVARLVEQVPIDPAAGERAPGLRPI